MCGIAGIIAPGGSIANPKDALVRMTDALAHRGPDSHGTWMDAGSGVLLGHRRLAIVDLTEDGTQPMISASGRYTIVFNGEIYNFRELRAELEGRGERFRGHSDTEVMLAAIELWGLDAALHRFSGMFAFALWDSAERVIHLARDRVGEKPLYYGMHSGALLFASELSAFLAVPGFRPEVDRTALTRFMRDNCVPEDMSILNGVAKLPPASVITAQVRDRQLVMGEPRAYWSALAAWQERQSAPFRGTFEEAAEQLESHLTRSIGRQMIADVPLGAFLSGGVDSTMVVALMQKLSTRPVRTFTIGFDDAGYNEAHHAAKVARHLDTEHTEMYVTPNDALAVIPKLASIYDEPFADCSQIPTFLVCQLARRHVTVALSGDGGDELFAGYTRYPRTRKIWSVLERIPLPLRRAVVGALVKVPAHAWDRVLRPFMALVPGRFLYPMSGSRLHKLAESAAVGSSSALYRRLMSHWTDPESIVIGGRESGGTRYAEIWREPNGDIIRNMMTSDLVGYLPDDILVKVDRAAMSVSLEGRMPMLDHELIEFSFGLPLEYLQREGEGKRVLKHVLYKHVPRELVERPKAGFGLPIDSWLRGPLRDWAESLLDRSRLNREGYFHAEPIRRAWEQHLAGQHALEYLIWDVLMFQAWLDEFRAKLALPRTHADCPVVRVA